MGFDTFTSKELMDIQDYTPLGTWPTDDILIGEVEKTSGLYAGSAGLRLHDHGGERMAIIRKIQGAR